MAEKITIARPYAQAVFELAEAEGDLAGWSQMLAVAANVAANPQMGALLDNPRVARSDVAALFLEICGGQLSEAGKNFIRVLAENRRLSVLPQIADIYESRRAAAEGTAEAEVVSATALSDAQKQAITEALSRRLGRKVNLRCTTDSSVLGGAIIRAGDLVIDGSALGRLNQLNQELVR